jgi:hypothetical protein
MVEIVRSGNKNLANCLDCGNVLRFNPRDIYWEYDPPRGSYEIDGYDYYYINCPCGSKLNVTSKISSNIAKKVLEIEKERDMSDYDL